jgi:hypothetical protein
MAGFGVSGVGPSGSAARELVLSLPDLFTLFFHFCSMDRFNEQIEPFSLWPYWV